MINEVIFYGSLLLCIALGGYYKRIEDTELKRNYGTGLGLLVTCLICGFQMYHTLLMVWGNILIIRCLDKKFIHQMSLAYTWVYLLFLHYEVTCSKYAMWLFQVMALRLVGLAFEIATCHTQTTYGATILEMPVSNPPTAANIMSYSYNFIGLHKGPYYKWTIYEDYFRSGFSTIGDCRIITEQKIKKAIGCSILYSILWMRCPPQIYYDPSFYTVYGTDFRYLYNIPQLLMYYLHEQIIASLSTSVCSEASFGVYPAKCHPLPGQGPTTHLDLLKLAIDSPDEVYNEEYNFAVMRCFDNEKLLLGPKLRDTARGWNMPTRYWFWAYIYKHLVTANKEIRSAMSFMVYTLWAGPSVQRLLLTSTLWLHLQLEKEYASTYVSDSMRMTYDIGFSIMRLFCLLYLTPCLIVEDVSTLIKYYNSIYWVVHWFLLFELCAALILARQMHHHST